MRGNNICSKFSSSKKAISPVVATALLLVVAVVSVVGFSGWFETFSSTVFVDVETQSSISNSNVGIETIVGDKLYINAGNNLTISKILIDGNECLNVADSYSGIDSINVSDCLSNSSTNAPEVVIISNGAVITEYVFLGNDVSIDNSGSSVSSLDCSSLGLAGGEWVTVQGNAVLGTTDFCVMKYEAKNVGGVATSQPALVPWVSISQTTSVTTCSNLGAGYQLISNAQWTTAAREAELIAANWNSGVVGSGSMWRGHTDNSPAAALSVSNVNDYYDQTGNVAPSIERRALELNSGEVIWDMGGNVYNWNIDTCTQNSPWYTLGWDEWTSVNVGDTEKTLAGPLGAYTSTNSVGQYYGCTATGNGFLRGGRWANGARAGAFALSLGTGPSGSVSLIGFRCSYEP